MKITLLTPALVAILGLALAGAPMTSQAQTSTTTAPDTSTPPAPTKPKKPEFRGSITAIDATSVTVATKDKTRTFAITPNTKFRVGKTNATLADFAVGDKVSGSYSTDASGALSANSLHKKAAPPAPTTTAPTPTTPPATP